METIELKSAPSAAEIDTASHQGESVRLEAENGEVYVFLPNAGRTKDGGYMGTCKRALGTILANKRSAALYLAEPPDICPLLILIS